MADRSVRVRLEAVINPYVTKMAEAEAATRKLSQSEKDLQKATVQLGQNMQRAGAAMTVGITAPLLLFAKNAAETAMTAQETANRVTVAFGAQEEALHDWSEGSARAMGLARHEAEGTAATFTTMFQEMGLGAGTSFKLSTGIVKLAADVGSFRDVDPTEMLTKMRAGIIGEYEPLRQLGIVLTDDEVKLEAVRLKLAQSTSEVSTAALVQARYSLILQQTSKDQGDYARTQDSATNSVRTAQAAYKDAMAELGGHFLPLIAEGAQIATAIAEAFGKLGPAGQTAILVFGGLAAATGPAIVVTGTLIRNLDMIALRAPMAATGLRTLTFAAGGIGLALGLAATAVAIFGREHSDAQRDIEDFTTALKAEAAGAENVVNQAIAKKLVDKGIDDLAASTGVPLKLIGEAVAGNIRAMGQFNQLISEGKDSAENWVSRGLFGNLEKDVHTLTGELDDSKDATMREAYALEQLGDESSGASEAVGDLSDKLDELYDATFGAQKAADRFTGELFRFSDGVRAAQVNGDRFASSLDASSETGRRNRDSLRGLISALFDYSSSTGASAATTAAMRGQLVETLTQLGFNRAEAEKFTSVLSNLGKTEVVPKVGLDASGFYAELNRIESGFGRIAAIKNWSGGSGSAPLPRSAPLPTGPGPEERAARERQQREREEATRRYLDALKDAEEERRRLEEATTGYLKALYDEQTEIEDNQYEFGVMSKDRYLEVLRQRLVGLKEFSDEWAALTRKIAEVEENALEDQLQRMQDFEAGRTFERGWLELAPQRMLSMQMSAAGAGAGIDYGKLAASISSASGPTWNPTFIAHGATAEQALATQSQKLRDIAATMG